MKVKTIIRIISDIVLIGLLLIVAVDCKMKEEENEIFELSSISPESKVSHLPSFTLNVYGGCFSEDSVIIFNGLEKPTTYIDSKRIICKIDTADITPSTFTAPSESGGQPESLTVSVLVRNPGEEGAVDSNTLDFAIYDNHRFSTPVSIDDRGFEFRDPAFTVDDSGNIYAVYRSYDNGSSGFFYIDFARSTDSGENWESPGWLGCSSYRCDNPCIALDSEGNINTAFSYEGIVYFMRSPDGGTSWSTADDLSSYSGESLEPAIAVDSDDAIIIAWPLKDYDSNYQVYFLRSTNGGASWIDRQNIFKGNEGAVEVCSPDITSDENNGIYVSWSYRTGGDVQKSCLNRSIDGGATWKTTDIDLGKRSCSNIAAAPNGDIYSVLASPRAGGIRDIVFRKSTDRGLGWSVDTTITCDRTASAPKMTIDRAGNINVVYFCEDSGKFLFSRSTDEGTTWSSEIGVAEDGAGDIDMALDSKGNLYFIYVDKSARHLYFIRSN